MKIKNHTHNEDADIHYQIDGKGPYLLLIPGGGGPRFSKIADLLAEHFTVIRYDRRCNSLSTGSSVQMLDLAQQARDIVAILTALNVEKTLVFGNSGGANIALKLVEDFPASVVGVIAHEPPAIAVLPDAERWFSFSDGVETAFQNGNLSEALEAFDSEMKGFQRHGELGNVASQKNLAFFIEYELHALCRYNPDFGKLKDACPIILTSGTASEDAYYARPAKIIAEQLDGAHYIPMSGHHFSFATHADLFASELIHLLSQLEQR